MKSQKIKTIVCMVLLAFMVLVLQGSTLQLENQTQSSAQDVTNEH